MENRKKGQKSILDICTEWAKNKLINPLKPINPLTNYSIKKNSAKYNELEKLCFNVKIDNIKKEDFPTIKKKSVLTKPLTLELCEAWMKNKYKNPITNYNINETSKIFKEFQEDCPAILANKKEVVTKKIQKTTLSPIISNNSNDDIDNDDDNDDKNDKIYYPSIEDPDFRDKLMAMKEINMHKIYNYDDILTIQDFEKKSNELCKGFDKSFFQYLMGHYLSYRMPYKSMLIYYSVGVGKTCTAITIAENFLISQNSYDEPKIWVIMPQAVEEGFKQQIFKKTDYKLIANQCTGDLYAKLANIIETTPDAEVDKRIKKLIKSRYNIFTYEGFATFYETNYTLTGKVPTDKVIIVDEAHNIRQGNSDDKKRVYNALTEVANSGINNKMILLSATPMYNEPSDIFDLIELLILNDKRTDIKIPSKIFDDNNELYNDAKIFLEKMASQYISYLRGKNPFNFAFKLSPKLSKIPILDKVIPLTENGNPIENSDRNWVDKVTDGIVISKLGKKQLEYFYFL